MTSGEYKRKRQLFWLLVSLTLLGAALRLPPSVTNRFHQDEALFSTAARLIATGSDPFLTRTSLLVDKPPLFYYILAGAMALTGTTEFAVRLPSLLTGILSIALIARLSWRLYQSHTATVVTALITALSPFMISFAGTAFSDPLFTFCVSCSLVLALEKRPMFAGILMGIAVAIKQSALFFVPLPLMLYLANGALAHRYRKHLHNPAAYTGGFLLIVFGLVIWELVRSGANSFWLSAIAYNDPGRLTRSDELIPHLITWSRFLVIAAGNSLIAVAYLIALIALPFVEKQNSTLESRKSLSSLMLLAWGISYFAFTWLLAFPVLDRYMLPIVPISALLLGRASDALFDIRRGNGARSMIATTAILIWLTLIFGPAVSAMKSEVPVGGDHITNEGIKKIASVLSHKPYGTVVYTSGMSWLLDYYLFDAFIYRTYFDSPAQLSTDLAHFGNSWPPRYLVLGEGESRTMLFKAVREVGFCPVLVLQTLTQERLPDIALFRLDEISNRDCSSEQADYTSLQLH